MKLPEMTPVESSNVDSVGYNSEQTELFVKFKNNSVYKYIGVGEEVFNKLLAAPSVGNYLNSVVKPSYAFERIM